MTLTIHKIFSKMKDTFIPENAAGVNAKLQFRFSGEMESDWNVIIKDQTCEVAEGLIESPDMTLSAEGQDFVDVLTGKIDPTHALMQGKLKFRGNMAHAMKLTSLWKFN